MGGRPSRAFHSADAADRAGRACPPVGVGPTWPRARRPTGEAVSATLSNHQNARPSRESELQPGFLISGGSDQLTFFVTLGESCSAFGSISRLGVVSLFRLNARPTRPNAISKIPAIISQCGYSSARSICPHKASTAPLWRGEVGGSETVCRRYLCEERRRSLSASRRLPRPSRLRTAEVGRAWLPANVELTELIVVPGLQCQPYSALVDLELRHQVHAPIRIPRAIATAGSGMRIRS